MHQHRKFSQGEENFQRVPNMISDAPRCQHQIRSHSTNLLDWFSSLNICLVIVKIDICWQLVATLITFPLYSPLHNCEDGSGEVAKIPVNRHFCPCLISINAAPAWYTPYTIQVTFNMYNCTPYMWCTPYTKEMNTTLIWTLSPWCHDLNKSSLLWLKRT